MTHRFLRTLCPNLPEQGATVNAILTVGSSFDGEGIACRKKALYEHREKAAMNKPKINRHCPVRGCRTNKPHAYDPIVNGLIREFASPAKLTSYVHHAMAELRDSICRDLADGKLFAWHARLRQPEELYIRTLYALFISGEKELHHILSGDTPNGLSGLYSKVNAVVFEGRGLLQVSQPGLNYGAFTPMGTLNDGAHVSFKSFMTCISLAGNPEYISGFAGRYFEHLNTYCTYLGHMHELFKAGKPRDVVLAAVTNLHRPASHWEAQQKRTQRTKPPNEAGSIYVV